MNADFYVGRRVECINASMPKKDLMVIRKGNLIKGAVYTVRFAGYDFEDVLGFRLEEIECTIRHDGFEHGFKASRFRLLAKTKTDISIFERMCDPKRRVKENA